MSRRSTVASPKGEAYLLVGGAGFIGSHFAERLLSKPSVRRVTIFDNFSSGRPSHVAALRDDQRLEVIKGDAKDLDLLTAAARGHDIVIHLASNPDIARAATEPSVDFNEGTLLSHHVAEAARRSGVMLILYASGSGVYGDLGRVEATEDRGPLEPVSTYGASKLAGEALLSSYSHMFGLRAVAFRFGNVVGPRQTHGVAFDFIRRLQDNQRELRILGDGTQSKSYIHVDDVIDAVLLAAATRQARYQVFNVATGDYITVREIADIVCGMMGLDDVCYVYSGGDRGWKGDVPVVRLNTTRIRELGWTNRFSSREAVQHATAAMLAQGRLG
jgi:UDP-glucose 4-epimerase